MNVDNQNNDEIQVFELKGECTIYEVADIHQKAINIIQQAGAIRIDMKEVTRIDSSVIQLLLSISKQQESDKLYFSIDSYSDCVKKLVDSVHCHELFN